MKKRAQMLATVWLCLALAGCQMTNLPAKAKAMQRAQDYATLLGMTPDTRLTEYYTCYEFGGGCEAHIAFTTNFSKDTLDSSIKPLLPGVSHRKGGGSVWSFFQLLRSESSPTVTVSVTGTVTGYSALWEISNPTDPPAAIELYPLADLSASTEISIDRFRVVSDVIDIQVRLIKN